jgi:hypothetical protein
MSRLLRLAVLMLSLWLCSALPAGAAGSFADWSAVVVAGDFHAHNGKPSEAFDNARRDVSRALVGIGFDPANLRQYSVRPQRYPDAHAGRSDADAIYDGLMALTKAAPGGCLVYFSSHGAPQGLQLGEGILSPAVMGVMLDRTCGKRPTVVVISACFSGVFVPALAESNRMVLTAARPDRTSFGCGQDDKYPYFDDCFLSSVPQAHDFPALGHIIQACVAARELKEGMSPPSEPQLFVGAELKPVLPLYAFTPPSMQPARFEGLRP